MERRRWFYSLMGACLAGLTAGAQTAFLPPGESSISTVKSKDGTPIAVECAGAGPNLLVVHGGAGDRTRWKPLFPLFASRFTVCAMDRRGHGASGDAPDYDLQKEAEDVAAVVDANRDNTAEAARMEKMIRAGEREQALEIFLREIVMISPNELAAMRARPSWPGLVASIESQVRQIRAFATYHFDPKKVSTITIPTLLLTGSKTASPELKQAIRGLMDSLPHRELFVFEGQEHNAMDTVPTQFADVVASFLLGSKR
jgi:pimeloyl-ACP methyl ester carboxylesterase